MTYFSTEYFLAAAGFGSIVGYAMILVIREQKTTYREINNDDFSGDFIPEEDGYLIDKLAEFNRSHLYDARKYEINVPHFEPGDGKFGDRGYGKDVIDMLFPDPIIEEKTSIPEFCYSIDYSVDESLPQYKFFTREECSSAKLIADYEKSLLETADFIDDVEPNLIDGTLYEPFVQEEVNTPFITPIMHGVISANIDSFSISLFWCF
jgi:hypothetical protein